ncbi:MAG TPA: peptide deformylase [Firmicutes bacterium]|nr:peptide deformylase [Bacillota bacterium]
MAKRLIVKVGDELLRKRSREVTEFDGRLGELLDDMRETMIAADGVGLAAPQVGVLKRAVVISPDGRDFYEFVNPVIVSSSGRQICREGCLSVPGISGEVERPKKIEVLAYDRNGKRFVLNAEGFLADICCHEFDHLDGVLFIDKMLPGGR